MVNKLNTPSTLYGIRYALNIWAVLSVPVLWGMAASIALDYGYSIGAVIIVAMFILKHALMTGSMMSNGYVYSKDLPEGLLSENTCFCPHKLHHRLILLAAGPFLVYTFLIWGIVEMALKLVAPKQSNNGIAK